MIFCFFFFDLQIKLNCSDFVIKIALPDIQILEH